MPNVHKNGLLQYIKNCIAFFYDTCMIHLCLTTMIYNQQYYFFIRVLLLAVNGLISATHLNPI